LAHRLRITKDEIYFTQFRISQTETENAPKNYAKARDPEMHVELYLIWRFKMPGLEGNYNGSVIFHFLVLKISFSGKCDFFLHLCRQIERFQRGSSGVQRHPKNGKTKISNVCPKM